MPFVKIDLMEGRPRKLLERLIERVSETVSETLDTPIERVRVVINEVPPHLWGIGGVPASRIPGRVPSASFSGVSPSPAAGAGPSTGAAPERGPADQP